jgi:hypothetical protein
LEPAAAAQRVSEHWAVVEAEHAAKRDLAGYLVNSLNGMETVMYEVALRQIPSRSLLRLKRNVNGRPGAIALGKEFVSLLRERRLPRIPGRAGAPFCIYWSEVTEDSDGPIEWCKPVPDDQADALAGWIPELVLRTEIGHKEAFVNLGPGGQATPAQWQFAAGSQSPWLERQQLVSAPCMSVTTLASASTPPTLPGKTTYGMPTTSGAASAGRNTEIRPGNSWPATSARLMPNPCTAMSCEVIPPLAMIHAGSPTKDRRTIPASAAETARATSRSS